jgi:hypothetical protein
MSLRYFVYRLIDDSDGTWILEGMLELPEQTDGQSMNNRDARSMVADAAIRRMMRSSARPRYSHIEYCELQGPEDDRMTGEGEGFAFDWSRCQPDELELKLGDEE